MNRLLLDNDKITEMHNNLLKVDEMLHKAYYGELDSVANSVKIAGLILQQVIVDLEIYKE